MEMHFPKYNYLYFYISNQNGILKRPIYYCITSNNPRKYSPRNSFFKSLYQYEKRSYKYYYKIGLTYYRYYIIMKYSVTSSRSSLYIKSSKS